MSFSPKEKGEQGNLYPTQLGTQLKIGTATKEGGKERYGRTVNTFSHVIAASSLPSQETGSFPFLGLSDATLIHGYNLNATVFVMFWSLPSLPFWGIFLGVIFLAIVTLKLSPKFPVSLLYLKIEHPSGHTSVMSSRVILNFQVLFPKGLQVVMPFS